MKKILLAAACLLPLAFHTRGETLRVKVIDQEGHYCNEFRYDRSSTDGFWTRDVLVRNQASNDPIFRIDAQMPSTQAVYTPYDYRQTTPQILLEVMQGQEVQQSLLHDGIGSVYFTVGPGFYTIRASATFQVDEACDDPLLISVGVDPETGFRSPPPSLWGFDKGGQYEVYRVELSPYGGRWVYRYYKRYTYNIVITTTTYVSPGETDFALVVLPRHPEWLAEASQHCPMYPYQEWWEGEPIRTLSAIVAQAGMEEALTATFTAGHVLMKNGIGKSLLASELANVIYCGVSPKDDLTLSSVVTTAIGSTGTEILVIALGASGGSAFMIGIGVSTLVELPNMYHYFVWDRLRNDLTASFADDLLACYVPPNSPWPGSLTLLNQGGLLTEVCIGSLRSGGNVDTYYDWPSHETVESGQTANFPVWEVVECSDCQPALVFVPPILTSRGYITAGVKLTNLPAGTIEQVTPPNITTTDTLPNATMETPYSAPLSATGGLAPYTWSFGSGSSPPNGLSLSSAGVLSGTAQSVGLFQFTVRVAGANNLFSEQDFQLNVLPPTGSEPSSVLKSVADTYLSTAEPDANLSHANLLMLGGSGAGPWSSGLVRFNLTNIPPGSTVDDVRLKLTSKILTSTDITIYEVTEPWTESTVTWYTRPTTGASIAHLLAGNTNFDVTTVTAPNLKTNVQKWVNTPASNCGMYLWPDGGGCAWFYSHRDTSTPAKCPQLVVTYRPPPDSQGDAISAISAKTSSTGTSIPQSHWQRDDSPYFYWSIPSSISPIVGYSIALDTLPGTSVNLTTHYYQYASGSIANGQHTFYVQSLDASGYWGPPTGFQIWVDREPPTSPSIEVNNGTVSTFSNEVTLTALRAEDNSGEVTSMSFSNNGQNWSPWEPFASSRSNWDLSSYGGTTNEGIKTVYVKYRDAARNQSAPIAATILYGWHAKFYSFRTNNATICITAYLGNEELVDIPETICGFPVRSLECAFMDCGTLKTVRLSSGITNIDCWTFLNCSNLVTVLLPDALRTISIFAFANCTSLETMNIPRGVNCISSAAFEGCVSLASFHVSPDNASYSSTDGVLFNKQGNTLVQCPEARTGTYYIPEGVTTVAREAFEFCDKLTNVMIPISVLSIDDCVFLHCSQLNEIKIPASVTNIGFGAFHKCYNLLSISVSPDNTYYRSFQGALLAQDTLMQYPEARGGSFTVPSTVTHVADYAFASAGKLTQVHLPDSVSNVGGCTFTGCSNLASVRMPDRITTIPWEAFAGCTSLTNINIPKWTTRICWEAFRDCASLATLIIPEGVECIEDGAFRGCISLRAMKVPNNVSVLEMNCFSGCTGLRRIELPEKLTLVEQSSFCDCSNLETVSMGSHVVQIGYRAFGGCTSLKTFDIPDSVKAIGTEAFLGCSGLSTVTIGCGVVEMCCDVFSDCSQLSGVYFKGSAPWSELCHWWSQDSTVAYYLPGTYGWDSVPLRTGPWYLPYPVILDTGPEFGLKERGFGFRLSWATNATVVIEASPDLSPFGWRPIATNTIKVGIDPATDGWSYFSDPAWQGGSARFYRLRFP